MAQRNPRPCPVLDVTDPGSFSTVLAEGADLRRHVPLYRIWRNGRLVEETTDAIAYYAEQDDLFDPVSPTQSGCPLSATELQCAFCRRDRMLFSSNSPISR